MDGGPLSGDSALFSSFSAARVAVVGVRLPPNAPSPDTGVVPATTRFLGAADEMLIDTCDLSAEMLIEATLSEPEPVASKLSASGLLPRPRAEALPGVAGAFLADVTRGVLSGARRPARRRRIELLPAPPESQWAAPPPLTLDGAPSSISGVPPGGGDPSTPEAAAAAMPSEAMRASMASNRRAYPRAMARCVSIVP